MADYRAIYSNRQSAASAFRPCLPAGRHPDCSEAFLSLGGERRPQSEVLNAYTGQASMPVKKKILYQSSYAPD